MGRLCSQVRFCYTAHPSLTNLSRISQEPSLDRINLVLEICPQPLPHRYRSRQEIHLATRGYIGINYCYGSLLPYQLRGYPAACSLFSPCHCVTWEVPVCTMASYRRTTSAYPNEVTYCASRQYFLYFYIHKRPMALSFQYGYLFLAPLDGKHGCRLSSHRVQEV